MTERVQKQLTGKQVRELKKSCNSFVIFNHRTLYFNKTDSYTKTAICFNENSLFFKAAIKCLSIIFMKNQKNTDLNHLFVEAVHKYTLIPERILYGFIEEDQLKFTVCRDCGKPLRNVECRYLRQCVSCNWIGF